MNQRTKLGPQELRFLILREGFTERLHQVALQIKHRVNRALGRIRTHVEVRRKTGIRSERRQPIRTGIDLRISTR